MTSTILAGGTIFDGTGGPRYVGNVLVKDGKVSAMSRDPITEAGARVIDVTGKWWCRAAARVPGENRRAAEQDGLQRQRLSRTPRK